ncbi:MAG: hypothetical protein KAS04_01560 [Candidatus Aenigmarchaeota archaeon]|nr:hypothetical protein [Candidatus Aenigmarchaeota archaeon]
MANDKIVTINKCKNCKYIGHISDGKHEFEQTFICSNPEHQSLNIKNIFVDEKHYPIIAIDIIQNDIDIPKWCKLPNAKPKTEERVLFASKTKLAIMKHYQEVEKKSDSQYLHGLENAIEIIETTVRSKQ